MSDRNPRLRSDRITQLHGRHALAKQQHQRRGENGYGKAQPNDGGLSRVECADQPLLRGDRGISYADALPTGTKRWAIVCAKMACTSSGAT